MKKHLPWMSRLLLWLALVGLSYGLARLLVSRWWPYSPLGLTLATLLFTLGLLAAYVWLLRQDNRARRSLRHAIHPIDALLPFILLGLLLLLWPFALYRFALLEWGAATRGILLDRYIEVYQDADTGSSSYYILAYEFQTAGGDRYTNTASVSRDYYQRLATGESVPVRYLPFSPRLSIVDDPTTPPAAWLTLFLAGALIMACWFIGAGLSGWLAARPSPPLTPRQFLGQYGLDSLLTAEDDPELWAAVVAKQFPPLDSGQLKPPNLRFGLGRLAPETRYKIQPSQAWCFEQAKAAQLRLCDCPPSAYRDSQFDQALQATTETLLFDIAFLGNDWPYYSIVLPRPTAGQQRAPVYTGAQLGFLHGYGQTAIWERQANNTWQPTEEILNWWAS